MQKDMRTPLSLSQSYLNRVPPYQLRTSQVYEGHCTTLAAMENTTRRKIQAMEWGLVLDKDDARVLDHAFANIPGLGNKIFDRIGLEGMHDIHLGPYPELVGEPSTSPTNVHVSDIPLVGRVLFYYTHDTDNPNHFPFSKLEAAFEQHP